MTEKIFFLSLNTCTESAISISSLTSSVKTSLEDLEKNSFTRMSRKLQSDCLWSSYLSIKQLINTSCKAFSGSPKIKCQIMIALQENENSYGIRLTMRYLFTFLLKRLRTKTQNFIYRVLSISFRIICSRIPRVRQVVVMSVTVIIF